MEAMMRRRLLALIVVCMMLWSVPALALPRLQTGIAATGANRAATQQPLPQLQELEALTRADVGSLGNGDASTQWFSRKTPDGYPNSFQFRRMVQRLLLLELIRLVMMQRTGINLSLLGGDFWVQLYLRVIAQGLGAELQVDEATGNLALVKGDVRVEVIWGDGVTTIISGGTAVAVPGDLGTRASSSFWRVADLVRTLFTQAQSLLPTLPPPSPGLGVQLAD